MVPKVIVHEEMKKEFEAATGRKATNEAMLQHLQQEWDATQRKLNQHIDEVRLHVNRLTQIAAQSNPLSSPQYIDVLIQGEIQEHEPGWQTRVEYLQRAREYAVTQEKIQQNQALTPAQLLGRAPN
jgi:hypothetical protein